MIRVSNYYCSFKYQHSISYFKYCYREKINNLLILTVCILLYTPQQTITFNGGSYAS